MINGLNEVIDPEEDSVRIYVFENKKSVKTFSIGPPVNEGDVI